MRKDTHLTDLGGLAVVAEIIGHLGMQAPDAAPTARSARRLRGGGDDHAALFAALERRISHRDAGYNDLGGKLDPPENSEELFLVPDWPMHHFSNNDVLNGGNNGLVQITIAPCALYPRRLLLVGDSFLHASIGLLAAFYREILFLRTPYFYPEIARAFRPHAMVSANVERYFSHVSSDEAREDFTMVPTLNGLAYQPGTAFAEAFSAMQAVGRTPYRKFLDRWLLDLR